MSEREKPQQHSNGENREKGGGGERDAGVARPSSRRHNHSETETSLSLSFFLGVGEGVSQVLIGLTDPQTDQPKDQFLEGFVWTVKLAGVKIA